MASSSKRNLLILIAVLCIVLLILLPVAFMAGQDPAATEPSTPSTTQTPTTQTPTTQVPTTVPPTTVPPTTAAPTEPPVVKTGTFTLSATGDMLIHSNVFNAAKTGSGYDFSQVFRFFADYVSNADYAVGNLETTLSGADFVHDNGNVGYSGYPQFNCPDEIISGMKNGGFDLVLTANNHTYDTRTVGLKRTLQVIIDQQLDYLGTQTDADEPDYLLVERNGITLGLMCYTYEDNSDPDIKAPNGHTMSAADAPLINTFNYQCLPEFYAEIEDTIAEMESLGAEATVLFIHWGYEYHLKQNSTQSKMAQALCDLGIDVIIGGHPHVVQPVELLTSTTDESHKTVCLYSLGNAVSNQRQGLLSSIDTAHTEDGMLFSVTFAKYSDGTVILESADLLPTWVFLGTSPVTGKWEYNILPLDDSVSDWYAQLQLNDSMYASCKASYDRTMAIVGSGMAEVDAYLAQNLADTEALLGVN
jgi:poly-gamma-glutamate synthesis protein (capsule biosynthesis protein)